MTAGWCVYSLDTRDEKTICYGENQCSSVDALEKRPLGNTRRWPPRAILGLPFSASFVFRNPSILLPPFRILGMMCWGTAPPRREEEADQRQQQRSQPCMPTSQEQRRVRHGLGRRKPEGMCRSSWVIQLVCVRSVCVPCCLKFMWGLPMRLNESSPSSR